MADNNSNKGGLVVCKPSRLSSQSVSILFQSDPHIGSAITDYSMLKEELEDAARKKARILINGDVFENLFHTNQKQYLPHSLHERIQGSSDQINRCLEWAVELYGPYAYLIDMVGEGNHDARSVKYGAVDIVALFVKELQRLTTHEVHYGGYSGLVQYLFSSSSRRLTIYYHHGWGSGSSLASAMSDFNRAQQFENVDVFWLGHKHCSVNAKVYRPSCPKNGFNTRVREVRYIRTGAYMDIFTSQTSQALLSQGRKGNYAADAGLQAHGKGGAWLNVTVVNKKAPLKLSVTQ